MKDKNDYVNDLAKKCAEEDNNKHYWKRTGRCDYKKCQSACCRFHHMGGKKVNGSILLKQHNYHEEHTYVEKVSNGYIHQLKPFLCPSITFDGLCVLHNKRSQSRVCKYFPMSAKDKVWVALKHICSYKFEKIKNEKWKKEKVEKVRLR